MRHLPYFNLLEIICNIITFYEIINIILYNCITKLIVRKFNFKFLKKFGGI
ncbi:group II intron reverse transcriptase/maturase [Methanobacterium oryzae]|uniref:group II intron reverse transcriptase/maturase n=1 Tax=Methanobacterium oryzae TaxID=69540 RepID=UPI003D20973D